MKRSEIYLKAISVLFDEKKNRYNRGLYGCNVLEDFKKGSIEKSFPEYFLFKDTHFYGAWLHRQLNYPANDLDVCKIRHIMLLFAYEIAKSEGN